MLLGCNRVFCEKIDFVFSTTITSVYNSFFLRMIAPLIKEIQAPGTICVKNMITYLKIKEDTILLSSIFFHLYFLVIFLEYSKAFHKKTGIYPSSFINKLKNT